MYLNKDAVKKGAAVAIAAGIVTAATAVPAVAHDVQKNMEKNLDYGVLEASALYDKMAEHPDFSKLLVANDISPPNGEKIVYSDGDFHILYNPTTAAEKLNILDMLGGILVEPDNDGFPQIIPDNANKQRYDIGDVLNKLKKYIPNPLSIGIADAASDGLPNPNTKETEDKYRILPINREKKIGEGSWFEQIWAWFTGLFDWGETSAEAVKLNQKAYGTGTQPSTGQMSEQEIANFCAGYKVPGYTGPGNIEKDGMCLDPSGKNKYAEVKASSPQNALSGQPTPAPTAVPVITKSITPTPTPTTAPLMGDPYDLCAAWDSMKKVELASGDGYELWAGRLGDAIVYKMVGDVRRVDASFGSRWDNNVDYNIIVDDAGVPEFRGLDGGPIRAIKSAQCVGDKKITIVSVGPSGTPYDNWKYAITYKSTTGGGQVTLQDLTEFIKLVRFPLIGVDEATSIAEMKKQGLDPP